jgi:uncharacterized protein (TIGR02646 family)
MRNIVKGREPESLTEHRAQEHADYDNYQDKDTLRKCLVTEQHGICCYCMGPIGPNRDSMKIEHWRPQEDPIYSDLQLDYSNLLGACRGGDGQPEADRTCDTAKGMLLLSRNPADPMHNVQALVHYDAKGRITSTNPKFDDEINRVLNLNSAGLINSRRGELKAFQKAIRIRGGFTRPQLQKILDAETKRSRPYCGVIIDWVQRKLVRLSA